MRLSSALVALAVVLTSFAVQAQVPYALSFDGVNDYVDVSLASPPVTDYTVSAWVYLRSGGSVAIRSMGVLSSGTCGGSTEFLIRANGPNLTDPQYLELGRCNFYGGISSTQSVPLNAWTHVGVTVSAAKVVSYYINGNPAGTWTNTSLDFSLGTPIHLGDNAVRKFDGKLDEVQIWNRALSAAEMQAGAHRLRTGTEPNLLAYFPFNEGSGLTTASLPSGSNATLVNGTAWVASDAPVGPPSAMTLTPTSVTTSNATLNGTFAPGPSLQDTVAWFEYGTSTNYGSTTPPVNISATNPVTALNQSITTGLLGTNYHFRIVATNSGGVTYGRDLAFNPYFVQSSIVLPALALVGGPPNPHGSLGICDYDNDGDYDIILSGKQSTSSTNQFYYTTFLRNDGNGVFTPVNSGLAQKGGTIVSGDFDNDNRVDVLAMDGNNANPRAKVIVYHNNGNGTFSEIPNRFPLQSTVICRAGDFDNDGWLDVAIARGASSTPSSSGFGLWRNNGKGAFGLWPITCSPYASKEVVWADFDNDDDLDLTLADIYGVEKVNQLVTNNGDGTFVSGFISDLPVRQALWSDFDNDGRLDFFRMWVDEVGVTFGEDLNLTGGSSGGVEAGFAGNTPSSTAVAGDYDNDGYRDLLLSSIAKADMLRNVGGFLTRLHLGWEVGLHVLPSFGDFNNDGKLDVLLAYSIQNVAVPAEIWLNNTAVSNTPPTAPTGLASVVSNGVVRFSWQSASDAQTTNSAGLSYNLRVGTTPGGFDVMSPSADPVTGFRRILDMGNTQMGLTGLLKVGPGHYYWSVQAIDTAMAGGPFAPEQSFWGIGAPRMESMGVSAAFNGSATLQTTFYPGELATTVYFQYGPTASYGQSTPPQAAGTNGLLSFQQTIAGLAVGIYHYRMVASNSAGVTFGADQTFNSINVLGGDGNNDGVVDHSEVNRALSNYWAQSSVYMTNPTKLAGGLFQFGLTNLAGWNLNVQGSANLITWTNLPTLAAPVYQFGDPEATNAPMRYYRLR